MTTIGLSVSTIVVAAALASGPSAGTVTGVTPGVTVVTQAPAIPHVTASAVRPQRSACRSSDIFEGGYGGHWPAAESHAAMLHCCRAASPSIIKMPVESVILIGKQSGKMPASVQRGVILKTVSKRPFTPIYIYFLFQDVQDDSHFEIGGHA